MAVRTDPAFPLIIIHGGRPLVIVSIQHMNNVVTSWLVLGVDLKYIYINFLICTIFYIHKKLFLIGTYKIMRSDFNECNSIKSLKYNVSTTWLSFNL